MITAGPSVASRAASRIVSVGTTWTSMGIRRCSDACPSAARVARWYGWSAGRSIRTLTTGRISERYQSIPLENLNLAADRALDLGQVRVPVNHPLEERHPLCLHRDGDGRFRERLDPRDRGLGRLDAPGHGCPRRKRRPVARAGVVDQVEMIRGELGERPVLLICVPSQEEHPVEERHVPEHGRDTPSISGVLGQLGIAQGREPAQPLESLAIALAVLAHAGIVPSRADFPRGFRAFGANGANRRVEFRTFGANGVSGPAAGLGPRARQLAVRTPQFVLTPLPARPAGFTIEPGILNRSPAEGECRSDKESSQEYCVHTQYNGTWTLCVPVSDNEVVAKQEIDDYLAEVAEPKRATLQKLRETIHDILRDAEEVISYGMPAFRLNGKVIAGFAAFKNHLAYLPHSGSVFHELSDDLKGYTSTDGSLHFPIDKPLPKALVRKLIAVRLKQVKPKQ